MKNLDDSVSRFGAGIFLAIFAFGIWLNSENIYNFVYDRIVPKKVWSLPKDCVHTLGSNPHYSVDAKKYSGEVINGLVREDQCLGNLGFWVHSPTIKLPLKKLPTKEDYEKVERADYEDMHRKCGGRFC